LITITTFPGRLHAASLGKDIVPTLTHTLLKVLFFTKSSERFISFTETPEEISLILDDETVKLFPTGTIKISEEPWRGIQISVGAAPFETGIVSSIAAPLGRANINIFYFTTASTDYILVPESKFAAAKACLKRNFTLEWTEENSDQSETLPQEQVNVEGPSNTLASFNQLITLPDLCLLLTSIRPEQLTTCIKDLIKLIFFPQSSYRFFSFTQLEDEVSLIIDEKSFSTFPSENLEVILNSTWTPIKRAHKAGFTETGVVSALAAPLSKANISMLYMSSFQTAYILVQKVDCDKAVERLSESNFVVKTRTVLGFKTQEGKVE